MKESSCGGHVYLAYTTKEELWKNLRLFVTTGIEANDKIIYIADENSDEEIKSAMLSWDSKTFERALAKGQVVIRRAGESYCPHGEFDPEKTFKLIEQLMLDAIGQGYCGIRGVGEMTWMFGDVLGVDKVYEYEQKLNEWLKNRKISVVCTYNKNRFGPEMINLMQRIHPKHV